MTSEASPSDTSRQSLVLINHLARIARRSSEAALEPTGLRPRHLVALTILRDHGAMTQTVLGEALRLDPTNLVGLLNELEQQGLLERRRDPDDRRRHIVEISNAGRTALTQAEHALASVQDEVLSGLNEDERTALHALLSRAADGRIACNHSCAAAAEDDSGFRANGEPGVC
ncbi:MAG: MarR family winged helix-turn-helix transcriptional regulator [Solirubrobacteraceae bacterium]